MIRALLNILLLSVGASVIASSPDISDIRTDTIPGDFTDSGNTVSVTYNVTQQVAAAQLGLAKPDYPDYDGNVTADALNLVYWDGCDLEQQSEIYAGWYDAYKIMTQNKDGVPDWNEAAALEYLGPNGINNPQHGQISSLFTDLNTMKNHLIPWTGWRLHMRCDDPDNSCPCPDPNTIIYAVTVNRDKTSGIARINWCPEYFNLPRLNDKIALGKGNPPELKQDLDQYCFNKGSVWYHELMHINWVSKALRYGPNEHITDMNVNFHDLDGFAYEAKAYAPLKAKILARYPYNTGKWVWLNADNMSLYALAKYVQAKIGNIYPNFPVVTAENLKEPWKGLWSVSGNSDTLAWNHSDPIFSQEIGTASTVGCFDDGDAISGNVVKMSEWAPDSAYPSFYIASLSEWAASQTWTPAAVTSSVPQTSQLSGTVPQCLLTSTSGAGGGYFCTCRASQANINTAVVTGTTTSYCAVGSGPWGPSGYPIATGVGDSSSAPSPSPTKKPTTTTTKDTCTPTFKGVCSTQTQCGCPTSATLVVCANRGCDCDCP